MGITIPPEALEAGVKAFAEAEENMYTTHAEDLRAAFLAIVEAWPGMGRFEDETGWDVHIELPLLVPLTPRQQEASDDQ